MKVVTGGLGRCTLLHLVWAVPSVVRESAEEAQMEGALAGEELEITLLEELSPPSSLQLNSS